MLLHKFENFTKDKVGVATLQKGVENKAFMKPEEVALKVINILNAKNGSVWYMRPNQMQPINIPDNRLPN